MSAGCQAGCALSLVKRTKAYLYGWDDDSVSSHWPVDVRNGIGVDCDPLLEEYRNERLSSLAPATFSPTETIDRCFTGSRSRLGSDVCEQSHRLYEPAIYTDCLWGIHHWESRNRYHLSFCHSDANARCRELRKSSCSAGGQHKEISRCSSRTGGQRCRKVTPSPRLLHNRRGLPSLKGRQGALAREQRDHRKAVIWTDFQGGDL